MKNAFNVLLSGLLSIVCMGEAQASTLVLLDSTPISSDQECRFLFLPAAGLLGLVSYDDSRVAEGVCDIFVVLNGSLSKVPSKSFKLSDGLPFPVASILSGKSMDAQMLLAYVGDPEPERRGGVIAISPDGSASELVRTPWMPRGATLSRRFLYTVEALPYVLPDEPAGDGSYVGVSAEIRFCRYDCSRLYETADVIVLRGESETCRWFAELAANRVGNQVLILPSRRCEEIVFMVSTGTGEILQVTYGTGVVRRIGNILDSGEDEWFLESADAFDETLFLIYRGNRSKSNSSRLVVKQLLGSVEDVFPLDSDTRAVSCLSDDTVALVERRNGSTCIGVYQISR